MLSLVQLLRHDVGPEDHARLEDVVDGAARPRLVDDGREVKVAPVERHPPNLCLVESSNLGIAAINSFFGIFEFSFLTYSCPPVETAYAQLICRNGA